MTALPPDSAFDAKQILDGIRRWVEIETPTEAPEQINKLATIVADGYRDLPATVERIAGTDGRGDHLVVRSNWSQDKPGILVLSHLDTVHPMGFIKRLPFKVDGDNAYGPGIYDMKGGAYLAYHAFKQICLHDKTTPLGITHLFVSDEEIGSPTSEALITKHGQGAKYVLVTEPGRDGGKVVTSRKGVARFDVYVKGVPAHSGTRPRDGRSAVGELANIIQTLHAMTDFDRGVTVNVGVVRGGTKPNVVAEEAFAEVDLRVPTIAAADEYVAKILGLRPKIDGVSIKVTGGLNRPPYEKTNSGAALYEHARQLAGELGFELPDTFTGGGSDGNFTAPYTGTLDGLGVDGDGAHTGHEHLYISSIAPRTKLLYRLYQTLK
jgi:glutamate carboxypeptidase